MSNIQNISRSRKRSWYRYRRSECLLRSKKLNTNWAIFDNCSLMSCNNRETMTGTGWNHWKCKSQEIMGRRISWVYLSQAWWFYCNRKTWYCRRTQKYDGNSSKYMSNQWKYEYYCRRYDWMGEWCEYNWYWYCMRNYYCIFCAKYKCGIIS